ncbi:MobP2 family relaxase [Clostridium baratii]|uniref:Relaxase n=1 Tax=Clostridium baratii TaxID=1561 RepID=A0A174VE80_9CLOT|nr:MobP2 family relaxase [Clostridium baratii]CUQ30325.1 Uncharacterised protein [Clostridium baratii]
MSTPGIVHKVKFIKANSRKFKNYIDYIDREEATRNYKFKEFSLYNDYMGNPEKSGSLFTESKDYLTDEDKNLLKQMYSLAQEKGSIMWQDVFSFDNEWLEKHQLYDKKTHTVDEKEIRKAVRKTMNELIEKENLQGLIWSASLHYNTDNIHVHIASVELNVSKTRGKRKPKTLINMKSKFANTLIDRTEEREKINNIIRKNIIGDRENGDFLKDKEMKKIVNNIIKLLPEDKKQWNYNYNSLSEVRPYLDKLTKYYIENYKKKEYKELIERLDKEEIELKEIYGEGEKFRYKDYKKNKIDELYVRMGNSSLKEIKNYLDLQKYDNNLYKKTNKSINNKKIISMTSKDIYRIKKALRKDFDNIKNQIVYERLQKEIEQDNNLDY